MRYSSLIRRIAYAIVLSLCLCWTFSTAEAETKIYPIEAKKAGILIQSFTERQKPTIVFVYASWCSICRENFPALLKMAREYKNQGLNVVALSMDREKSALERYLDGYGDIPFTPYLITQRYSGEFASVLRRSGIRYSNSIPYTIVYNSKGALVGQGNIMTSTLEPVIAKLFEVSNVQGKF